MSDQPFAAVIVPMGAGPVDPGFGNRPGHSPVDPGFGHGNPAHPWLPGHGGGANSGHIDNTLPVPPAPPGLNPPPPQIWPPTAPIFPAGPDNTLPPPGTIWPPLPPGMPAGELLVLVYITGIGWRWTVIDASLGVDNTLPPTPEPK